MKQAREKPDEVALLFEDEASFYRQPSQAWLWSWMGRHQPKMRYSQRSNTRMRVVGFLEACTGQVLAWDMSQVTVGEMARCVGRVSAGLADKKVIYIVWDNWLVHDHPTVQAAIQKDSRIRIVSLPTYAPWLNNIEKFWRLLRQHVAHAHPWSDDFIQFRQTIRHKVGQYANGSPDLLRYVGLST